MVTLTKNMKVKYLTFDSTDENKEVIKKYTKLWGEIIYLIKATNGGKTGKYVKDLMKIKFSSDDDLPLKKQLNFHAMTIVIISFFEENGKYYPQIFLDECLYEL